MAVFAYVPFACFDPVTFNELLSWSRDLYAYYRPVARLYSPSWTPSEVKRHLSNDRKEPFILYHRRILPGQLHFMSTDSVLYICGHGRPGAAEIVNESGTERIGPDELLRRMKQDGIPIERVRTIKVWACYSGESLTDSAQYLPSFAERFFHAWLAMRVQGGHGSRIRVCGYKKPVLKAAYGARRLLGDGPLGNKAAAFYDESGSLVVERASAFRVEYIST